MRGTTKSAANSPVVTITIHEPDGYARIDGDLWPLRNVIASYIRRYELGSDGRVAPGPTCRPFVGRCLWTGRMYVATGLVPTIIDTLRAAGIEPKVKRVGELPHNFGAASSVVTGLHSPWDSFATAIDSNPEGVLEIAGTRALIQGLTTICRLYPDQPILILAASQDACRWLRWRIQAVIGEPVELGLKWQPIRERIVVSPFRPPISAREFGLVVVAFGNELGGDRVYRVLNYIFREVRRRYVFVQTVRRLGCHERDTARALFGSTIWNNSASPTTTPVGVYYCDSFAPAPASRERGLTGKRQGIWRNAARNQAIATAARAMLNRDINQLWELGLLLDHQHFPEITGNHRVAIVVEGSEHAAELHRLLPGWPVMRSGSSCEPGTDGGTGNGMIVTLARAVVAGVDCSALLWAAGGVARPIAGFPLPGASMGLVIDFANTGEKQEELRRRIRQYHARDWDIDARFIRAADGPQTIQTCVIPGDPKSHMDDNRDVDAGSPSGRSLVSKHQSRRKTSTTKHRNRSTSHINLNTGRKDKRHKHKRTGTHSGTRAHLRRPKRT
jgi:hypothetical protein